MSDLYIARQEGLGGFERTLVIKMLQDRYAQNPRVVAMFLNEARLAAKLNHSSIVHVYDAAEEDGSKYIAMEYIHGETLSDILRRGVELGAFLPLEHALHIVGQVADGLDYAHGRRGPSRIAHCDISPSNIMVSYEGQPKIIDFGIARVEAQIREEWGMRSGKASYMSPEQATGVAVDHRSDIFSLGIILYEITSAHRLWRGPSEAVKRRIVSDEVPPPTSIRPDYPPALEKIVMRALEKRPEDRYQSADEMRHDLEELAAAVGFRSGTHRLSIYLHELFPLRASRADGGFGEPRLSDSADSIPLPTVGSSGSAEEIRPRTSATLPTSGHVVAEGEMKLPDGGLAAMPSSRRPSKPKLVLGAVVVTFCSLTAAAMYWQPRIAKTANGPLPDQTRRAEERRAAAAHTVALPSEPPATTIAVAPLPDPQAVPATNPVVMTAHDSPLLANQLPRHHRPQHQVAAEEDPGPTSSKPALLPTALPAAGLAPSNPPMPMEPSSPRSEIRPASFVTRAPNLARGVAPAMSPGFVDTKSVEAVVRRHAAEVQECFDRALMEHADLRGRFTVRATVDPDGHVLTASPTTVLDGGGRLQTCVLAAFERWTFPQPTGGVKGTITYAFSFQ